jgi:hypothetical protein
MSLKNSKDTIGNRTRDLLVCSVVALHMYTGIMLSKGGFITASKTGKYMKKKSYSIFVLYNH